jgi:lysophospholipase L1-like esterase
MGGPFGTVTIIGDSLTQGVSDDISAALDTAGVSYRLDARVGRPTREALPVLAANPPDVGSTVIIALGTNDRGSSTAAFQKLTEEVVAAAAPAAQVLWVNLALPGSTQDDAINTALDAAALSLTGLDGRPRLTVVDWHSVADTQTSFFGPDGVHHSSVGQAQFSALIAAAARGGG